MRRLAFVAEHNKHAKNPNAEREVYDKAKDLYKKAQIKLGEAIEKQTNRLARDSSVYPRGRGLKKLRRREAVGAANFGSHSVAASKKPP